MVSVSNDSDVVYSECLRWLECGSALHASLEWNSSPWWVYQSDGTVSVSWVYHMDQAWVCRECIRRTKTLVYKRRVSVVSITDVIGNDGKIHLVNLDEMADLEQKNPPHWQCCSLLLLNSLISLNEDHEHGVNKVAQGIFTWVPLQEVQKPQYRSCVAPYDTQDFHTTLFSQEIQYDYNTRAVTHIYSK